MLARERESERERFDDVFLGQVRSGDPDATATLLDAHRRNILWRLQHLHGVPTQDAEDVLQATYQRFLAQRARVREGVSGYLLAIAESAAIDYHRRRATESRAMSRFAHEVEFGGCAHDAEQLSARADVARLLPRISRRCHELLAKVILEERTHAEYADETRTPRGTVGTTIARCLAKARDLLRRP